MAAFTPLSHPQKEAIGLVQVGVFLEYFDFALYMHMAVIINTLFFPPTNTFTKSLLTAFSFSMAYFLRPIGSFIFGILGDLFGRKANIIISMYAMSISSFLLACMPTFAHAGIKATLGVLFCRIIQGISSAVEVVGAKVYITEMLKAPKSYYYCSLIAVAVYAGSLFALSLCSFITNFRPNDGWLYIFFLGSGIAVVGSIARQRLKENPLYLDAKRVVPNTIKIFLKNLYEDNKHNVFCYICIEMLSPVLVFVSYFYSGDFLSRVYHYTPNEIIQHNTLISCVGFISTLITARLTHVFFPFQLLKFSGFALLIVLPIVPFIYEHSTSAFHIFLAQATMTALDFSVGAALFAKGFPIIGRYTSLGMSFSIARAIGAILTSYVCVIVGQFYGFFGVSILLMLMTILYLIGLYKFKLSAEDQEIKAHWEQKKKFIRLDA